MGIALPIMIAVAAWWLSTVVILYRSGLPSTSFRRTFGGATALLFAGVAAVWLSRDNPSTGGAYLGFFGGLAIFGWNEVSYLFGFVSGPRPQACPASCSSWQRFSMGVKTCLYHEIAVVASVTAVWAMTAGSANQVAFWTLVVLWLMRWSAKMNIFLGVRNLHTEFWPDHLAYLKSYARERRMNALFPWSILVSLGIVVLLVSIAANGPLASAERTGAVLLATLLSLALIEHVFLMLRIPDELLWLPGLQSRRVASSPGSHPETGPSA